MDFSFLDTLKYDDNGLIPCVAQDAESGEVLMVAYMNRDSLKATIETGLANYWSRSRKKYWVKGESSGHTQEVRGLFFDCDLDCIVMKVKQNVAACHEGYRSCFYRRLDRDGGLVIEGTRLFDPGDVYGKKG